MNCTKTLENIKAFEVNSSHITLQRLDRIRRYINNQSTCSCIKKNLLYTGRQFSCFKVLAHIYIIVIKTLVLSYKFILLLPEFIIG